jgi:hypothetical protein
MALYTLKPGCGVHFEPGIGEVKPGETFESDKPLCKIFPLKFEEYKEAPKEIRRKEPVPAPTPGNEGSSNQTEQNTTPGNDGAPEGDGGKGESNAEGSSDDGWGVVTSDFNTSNLDDVVVKCKGGWCNVFTDGDDVPLNETKLRKKDVQAFLDSLE